MSGCSLDKPEPGENNGIVLQGCTYRGYALGASGHGDDFGKMRYFAAHALKE